MLEHEASLDRKPSTAEVRRELEAALDSKEFRDAPRMAQFLRYIVEESLAGRSDGLKEYTIGVAVFGRRESFDPRLDPVVRVQARNLRHRLARFYAREKCESGVIISVPLGGYAPHFGVRPRNETAPGEKAPDPIEFPVLPAAPSPPSELDGRRLLPWAGAAVLAASLLSVSALYLSEAPVERSVEKRSFTPTGLVAFRAGFSGGETVVISPDGQHIAYVADDGGDQALWIKDADQFEPRKLPGTEGAQGAFWSPDGRFIGFASGGELKRVAVEGGPTFRLCSFNGDYYGGTWSPDGQSIAFSASINGPEGILEVPALGGEAELLFNRLVTEKGPANTEPHYLPQEAGAQSLLFGVMGSAGIPDIALHNFETGKSVILAEGWGPVYSPSGHILYRVEDDGLWALPFSLDSLRVTGEPFPVAKNASIGSVSQNGTLVYVHAWGEGRSQMIWVDRAGEKVGEIGAPQKRMLWPALSPDESRVAVRSPEAGSNDIWLHETKRPVKQRLTYENTGDYRPFWSHDNSRIVLQSSGPDGRGGLYSMPADGSGEMELLVDRTLEGFPRPWGSSRDGKYFVYTVFPDGGGSAIRYRMRNSDYQEVLATPFHIDAVSLSPDSRFVAYCSDESGEVQVYVSEFPSGTGKKRVSIKSGCRPRWSRDGSELYYVANETNTLMTMKITTAPTFSASVPTPPFTNRPVLGFYDVSSDGRFVVVDFADTPDEASIQIVENWYEEFRDREQ